jgi:hypothetical protein
MGLTRRLHLTDDYIWHTNTKERAGEKFSTLAEAVAFVESPEGRNWEKMTVGFRWRKRIRLGKGIGA